MKKILICIPKYSFFYNPLKKSFSQLGYKVYFTDYRHGDLLARFIDYVFSRKVSKIYISLKIYLISVIIKPDIFLTIKGESLDLELIKKISKRNIISVNWFPDPLNLWGAMVNIAPSYNYFFHFDPLIVRKLEKEGIDNVYYLPFAAETFPKKEPIQYDISFVGTYDKLREKNLLYLRGFNLNIWGDKRWYKSKLKKFVRGERVTPDEMHKIIKRSKINVNFHHSTTQEGTNLRTFQVIGCKAFLLTEYVKDLKKLFKVNKEIVCFKNLYELKKLANYYLKRDSLRKKIAHAGFMRVQKKHTYKIRLNQMLQIINA